MDLNPRKGGDIYLDEPAGAPAQKPKPEPEPNDDEQDEDDRRAA
jgi:hypothetical protein